MVKVFSKTGGEIMVLENKEEKQLDEILARLLVTAYKIEEKAIQKSSGKDLTISEVHVLREIPGERPRTMSMVADGLKISVGALTTAMDKLTEKGYVKRFRGKTDKRTMKVVLTPKGREANNAHNKFHKELVDAAIKDLDEKEKQLLLGALNKIDVFFESEAERWK